MFVVAYLGLLANDYLASQRFYCIYNPMHLFIPKQAPVRPPISALLYCPVTKLTVHQQTRAARPATAALHHQPHHRENKKIHKYIYLNRYSGRIVEINI